MKKILLSLALAVGLTATAGEVTFDFVGQDYGLTRESGSSNNYLSNGTTITNDGATIVLNNLGTGDTNWRLWKDGLRATKAVQGQMTISVPNAKITGVSVSIANNATNVSYNGATAVAIAKGASHSWTETSDNAVLLFTQSATTAVSSLTITYEGGAVADMDVEMTITPVWVNDVANGEANPIPDADGGWGKPTASNSGDKTVCRFAVGKDGKLLMNNHKENAIMAWDGKAMTTFAKLPAVTVTKWTAGDEPGDEMEPNTKWNGTAITTDDAGNVIYDYCFINADKSLKYWGVVAADGTITDVELSTPLADLGTHGRLDILGHIVGDVNSTKGGIGYATTPGSNNVIMFHFKGDGKKVTSLTAKSFEVEGLASNGLYVPSPKYLTVDELMANGTPEKEFYVAYGGLNSEPVLNGYLASGDATLTGFGNRQYNTSAVFSLLGHKYIVRSYTAPNNPNISKLTGWRGVMTFGIFDLATGELIASWQDSEYSNFYGMGTITAEPVDASTVNIYMYVCTGSKDDNNPAVVPGAYGGMFTVTAKEVPAKPNGTENRPYIISTPEDLVNMNNMLKASGYTYFEFANDIDMTGVTYAAPAQTIVANVHLDGKNHVIKNLKINGAFAGLFALMNGSVKNLGFVDIDLTCNNWGGAGAIAGYIANNEPTTIENCFVTGKIQGQNAQLGSFTCGNKHNATISNCYSSATITSTGGGMQGGFVGAIMYISGGENTLTINNSYFAGSVSGANVGGFVGANQSYQHPATGTEVININNCALLSATLAGTTVSATANAVASNGNGDASLNGLTTATINAENVMVGDKTTIKGAVPTGAVAQAEVVKAVMGWEGFNATQVDATTNLPILAWQTGVKPQPAGTETDPFIIATAEDLCNAYLKVKGGEYWFKQTADIDMADVKVYHAIAGNNGVYTNIIHYDGQNHLIKNFAPTDRAAGDDNGYYCTSVFGVAAGEISNLGVVDAKVVTAQGAGILAAYAGHSTATALILDNVFVTGEVTATGGYTGGMFGTNGNWLTMTNCFANVKVTGTKYAAGILGRASNNVDAENVYVAGSVASSATETGAEYVPYLFMGTNGTPTYTGWEVYAFNTGATAAMPEAIKLGDDAVKVAAESDADAVAKVAAWKHFSAEKTVLGLPGLAAFDYVAYAPGTEANPFIIATAEDLCNAYLKVKGGEYWFKQTADIDMADVKVYHAIAGNNGVYTNIIHYDGQNHLIKNFAPTDRAATVDNGYYCTSVFGVAAGEISNLGVVDAKIVTAQGAGILAAYAGHSTATALILDNVFVTGEVTANGGYTGGMFGTNGNWLTMTNCFANVKVTGTKYAAGILGRASNNVDAENVYVAGSVASSATETGAEYVPYLFMGTNGTPTYNGWEVYAFNTGAAAAMPEAIKLSDEAVKVASADDAAAIAKVAAWKHFSAEKTVFGLPGLAAFDYTVEVAPDGTEAHPYIIATAEDLCNAYLKVKEGTTYFVQTADIDMEGVTDYHAIVGNNGGGYSYKINYDGQYHLIKNFAPKDRSASEDNGYYCTSVFGVASGYIKNLGVVDAKIVTSQGAGILAAYAGHSTGSYLQLEKVFVTGEVTGTGSYTGGMFGCTGNELTLYDCFANVKVNGSKITGGIVGRANNFVAMEKVYVAGTVASAQTPYLVMSTSAADGFDGSNVYAFNTGADEAMPSSIELWGDEVNITSVNDAAAITKIAGWLAFSDVNTVYGLPGLAGFDYSVAKPNIANSIKETIAFASGTKLTVNYELTVGFVNYNNVFACDAAGDFIQLYGKNTLKAGDVIPAGWEATYDFYKNNTPELKDFNLPEVTEGSFTAAVVAPADVTTALVNHVVTINDVVLAAATPAGQENFTGKVGDIELSLRNNYKLASVEAGTYNITVVVTIYNNAPSLYVVNYEKSATSGLYDLEAADDAEAIYYNLQGVRVENPEKGLYIRVRGNVIDKVVK